MRAVLGVPLLEGEWDVEVRSSHESHAVPVGGKARIKQTWTKLAIEFEMRESRSKSTTAAMTLASGATPELVYTYGNEPLPGARNTMVPFIGMARLRIEGDGLLVGDYFTGRGRQTHGSITLRRRPRL